MPTLSKMQIPIKAGSKAGILEISFGRGQGFEFLLVLTIEQEEACRQ